MSTRPFIRLALAVWFIAILALGFAGVFVGPAGAPPIPIALGFITPIAVFLVLYFGSRAFRQVALGADVGFITAVQAWRAGGLGFLELYAHGLLPGLFAWPAGLGDIAVGLTAPFLALALTRNPDLARSRRFVLWNLFGILDLVVAVSMGALASGVIPGLTDVTTAPMAQMPLVLIPAFFVPLFVMLHLTALFQARYKAEAAAQPRWEGGAVAA